MASGKKTIRGGCHCGLIQYTCNALIDASTGALSAARCNCTFCQKFCSANLRLEGGASDFNLVSPSTTKDDIGIYAPKGKTTSRHFCKSCGVHVWMEGFYEHEGQRHEFFIVNLPTVDQPQDGVDLSLTKITYWDGLRDNFQAGRQDGPFPNGLV